MPLPLTRRALILTLAASCAVPAYALIDVEETILAFTDGAPLKAGRVTLDIEESVTDGFTVPITFAAASAMAGSDLVESMMLLAPANPFGKVAIYRFSRLSGEARVSTRIRLAATQTLIGLARYADGSCWSGRKHVEVQINGCET
jgi:sulfur-oxidizing protein SoxY